METPANNSVRPRDLSCPKCKHPVSIGRAVSSTFARYSWNCDGCGSRLSFCYKRYALVSFLNWIFCCIVLIASAMGGLFVLLGSFFIVAAFVFIMMMTIFSSRYYKVVLKEPA